TSTIITLAIGGKSVEKNDSP
ncbi:hypothetical protein ABC925_18115, partial [Staphylococcus aureus]